jgi:hypothetical protein
VYLVYLLYYVGTVRLLVNVSGRLCMWVCGVCVYLLVCISVLCGGAGCRCGNACGSVSGVSNILWGCCAFASECVRLIVYASVWDMCMGKCVCVVCVHTVRMLAPEYSCPPVGVYLSL